MKDYAEWFYKSPEWKRNRKAFLASKFYICERCQNRNGIGNIAHHKKYITLGNINDENITMSWKNLECLCQVCHNREHHREGEAATMEGVTFGPDGQLIKSP